MAALAASGASTTRASNGDPTPDLLIPQESNSSFLVPTHQPTLSGSPMVSRAGRAAIVHAILDRVTTGESGTVRLRLFDDTVIEATIDRIEHPEPGVFSIQGHLNGVANGSLTFFMRDGRFTAIIHGPGLGTIDIDEDLPGQVLVRRLDESNSAPRRCAFNEAFTAQAAAPRGSATSCPWSISTLAGYACDDGLTIDVMVYYTQAALNAAGGSVATIESHIDTAAATTNQALGDSAVSSRIRVIRKALINYNESHSALTDLSALENPADGIIDFVHAERDQYGADLVCMWVDNIETGGVAHELTALGPDDDGRAGFSVMRQDNWSFETMAHELGHNFGCQHDRANAPAGSGFFYYSYGFREPGSVWHTIMAYPPGTAILNYSNPNVSYNGPLGNPGSTGVGGTNPNTACNNALTIINTAWTVANFRPSTITPAPAARLYVKPTAPAGGNGSSWATAMRDAQDAITTAVRSRGATTEIWIAAGTYKPDRGRNDRLISFRLATGVSIYGGFAGTETLLSQRNPAANVTTLSGDIGVSGDASDNTYHVLDGTDLNATAVLDGFTITGGNANGAYPHDSGGGMRSLCGGPTINNCRFTGNFAVNGGALRTALVGGPTFTQCTFDNNNAQWGGAIGCYGSGLTLTGCTFSSNISANGGGAIDVDANGAAVITLCNFNGNSANFGGGVYCHNGGTAQLNQCAFTANSASTGGALYSYAASPTIGSCTFTQNTATGAAGAVSSVAGSQPSISNCTFSQNSAGCCGGAVLNDNSSPVFTACTFNANTADYGGAVWNLNSSTGRFADCLFFGNNGRFSGGASHDIDASAATYAGCVFSGNRAQSGFGGAFYDYTGATPTLINCSLSGNFATGTGGALYMDSASPTVTNSVLWQNSDVNGMQQSSQMTLLNSSVATINYCLVQGWTGSLGGAGNSGANPLFVDADGADNVLGTTDDNLRAQSSSPCIDSGSNSAVPAYLTLDAAGNPRFANAPCIVDTGVGTAPIVDRGAYEFIPLAPVLGDVNGDSLVSLADVPGFAAVMVGADIAPAHVAAADMNCDGLANGRDIAPFVLRILGP